MFLNEIISLFEEIYKEWKINKEHVNRQHQEFLNIASKAIRQTLSYISPSRKERDKRIEEQLSELWAQVAVAVQPLDPDLASRCYLKSNYWADPDRLSDEEIKKARIEIKRIEKEIEGYFKGRTIVENKKTTGKKVKLSNAKPSYKKIGAIIVSLIIISAAFTTFIVNLDKIKEKYSSQKLQAPKTTDHNLPRLEAKTSGDSSPAIITSGPNSSVTVNYDSPESKKKQIDENKLNMSPGEIFADVESRPLFQQKESRKYYNGLKVKWQLYLFSVDSLDGKTAQVYLKQKNTVGELICCDIEISSYPQLKVAKDGSVIWVSGKINKVGEQVIYLSDVSLEFE